MPPMTNDPGRCCPLNHWGIRSSEYEALTADGSARRSIHRSGHSHAASIVMTRPATPWTVIMGEIVRSASLSRRPLKRVMIQKPASFIHGKGFEPQPMFSWEQLNAEYVFELRWWTLAELQRAHTHDGLVTAPRHLAALLRDYLIAGPPNRPLEVDP